jgi:hypothetical protein
MIHSHLFHSLPKSVGLSFFYEPPHLAPYQISNAPEGRDKDHEGPPKGLLADGAKILVGDVHDGPQRGDNKQYAYKNKQAMTHVSLLKLYIGVRAASADITGIGVPQP